MMKKFIASALVATLVLASSPVSARTVAVSASSAAVWAQNDYVKNAPSGAVKSLLRLEPQVAAYVGKAVSAEMGKLPSGSPAREYFSQILKRDVSAITDLFAEIRTDVKQAAVSGEANPDWSAYYVSHLKDAIKRYKADIALLRAYNADPSAVVSDAQAQAVRTQMIALQNVFVKGWNEAVGPYLKSDYKESGKMKMSFSTDGVDFSIDYKSYTSILSMIRGEQSATVDGTVAFALKKSENFPDLVPMSGTIDFSVDVKVFEKEVFLTFAKLDPKFTVDPSADPSVSAVFAAASQKMALIKGKTLRLGLENLPEELTRSMKQGFTSSKATVALDKAVQLLATDSIFVPVAKTQNGYLLMTNQSLLSKMASALDEGMDMGGELADAAGTGSIAVPAMLRWADTKDGGAGYFFDVDAASEGEANGYVWLSYVPATDSAVFSGSISEVVSDADEPASSLTFQFDRDAYVYSFNGDGAVTSMLQWKAGSFDWRYEYVYGTDKASVRVSGVADPNNVDLSATYNDEKVASLKVAKTDNRYTYSFSFDYEFPIMQNLLPVKFTVDGYADQQFGDFPIDKPTGAIDINEFIKQNFPELQSLRGDASAAESDVDVIIQEVR